MNLIEAIILTVVYLIIQYVITYVKKNAEQRSIAESLGSITRIQEVMKADIDLIKQHKHILIDLKIKYSIEYLAILVELSSLVLDKTSTKSLSTNEFIKKLGALTAMGLEKMSAYSVAYHRVRLIINDADTDISILHEIDSTLHRFMEQLSRNEHTLRMLNVHLNKLKSKGLILELVQDINVKRKSQEIDHKIHEMITKTAQLMDEVKSEIASKREKAIATLKSQLSSHSY